MRDHKNCHVEPVTKPVDLASSNHVTTAFLQVGGMGCQNCATRVRNGLILLEGVLAAEVDVSYGLTAVAFDSARLTTQDLIRAVANAGNDGRHNYTAQVLREVPVIQTGYSS